MNPSDLYSMTLSVLTSARAAMLTPAFHAAEQMKDPDERLKASQTLLDIQQAIIALSTASLGDIAAKMKDNEKGLTKATANLKKALQKITEVKNVIDAASSVLGVVAKIVPFL